MLAFLGKALLVLLAAYAGLAALVWWRQERIAFPAPRTALPAPAEVGLPGSRITVTTADGVALHGWYLPPDSGTPRPAPGLLWFPGNAETIGGVWPLLAAWRPAEFGLLILDYRGYGTSDGRPTEAGLYRDGEAAWDALVRRADIDAARVVVFGRSLGSAVALHVASVRPARAVVLESPFSTAAGLRRAHYPFLPGALLRLELDNVGRAARLEVPLLVFHGADDRIVPPAMGEAVAAAGRGAFQAIAGADHNSTFAVGGSWYRATMAAFLRRVVS
jgi:fermentation-respiration switch protein FrsA (DUF1100 family)